VPTFLLTWNPDGQGWSTVAHEAAASKNDAGTSLECRWGVGIRKSGISVGDRAFVLRQRHERGIVASGRFTSEIYTAPHWGDPRRPTTFADIDLDVLLPVEARLPVEELRHLVPGIPWNHLQGSGVRAAAPGDAELEEIWAAHVHGVRGGRGWSARCGHRPAPVGDRGPAGSGPGTAGPAIPAAAGGPLPSGLALPRPSGSALVAE